MQAIAIAKSIQKVNGLKQLTSRYQNYFFDLDGVVWIADKPINGAIQSLQYLKSQNKNLFFITNNSTRNREQIKMKFKGFGFDVQLKQIYCSSYLAGLYLQRKFPLVKNILIGGNESMTQEIRHFGYNVTRAKNLQEHVSFQQILENHFDPNIQALILGQDSNFNYKKSCMYSLYLQKGVKFLGTNPDRANMRAFKVPGVGSMIKMLQESTNRRAQIIGKPNRFALDLVIEENNLDPSLCLMIGDNLETDILFGKSGGVDTLATLSGVSSQKLILNNNIASPDYYCEVI